ncbi:MAG: hypothetical protein PHC61_12385 [Chitinivibrionales bacterium]|nr:hypothetical protein [Chitinivibrionales bacterium]
MPTTQALQPNILPYGEMGVFGVSNQGRLMICYTEGYKEKEWLKTLGTVDPRQNTSLRWVTNVVINSLAEGSLAR